MKRFILAGVFICSTAICFFDVHNANSQSANPSDIQQGNSFLASLPPACKNSSMSTKSDGTVVVRILCEGNGQSTDGLIEIKNGVVKKIK